MNSKNQYSSLAKTLYWVTAIVIIVSFGIGFFSARMRNFVPIEEVRTYLYLHKEIATTTLFLIVARFGYRLLVKYPKNPDHMHRIEMIGAKVAHMSLYILMVAVPVSGWFWSSVAGSDIPVLGLFNLPPLLAKDRSLYDFAHLLHQILAWALGIVIVLHVAGALKHHFVDKNLILRRMLPGKIARKETDAA